MRSNSFITGLAPSLALLCHRALAAKWGNCDTWAEKGECHLNPRYMLDKCADACARQAEVEAVHAVEIETKIGHIETFFDLEAEDIENNVITFDKFKGEVTVITNVASYCGGGGYLYDPNVSGGYTEDHYRGLVELNERFRGSTVALNILTFPCDQFGNGHAKEKEAAELLGDSEYEMCPGIKKYATREGAEFTMMNKVDVNGLHAHHVYHFLKKAAGPPHIGWNFATYYIISPEGTVQSLLNVNPMDLVDPILEAMGGGTSEL
mmetsp:Transcript_38702/g.87224  ORF Transcript_38702/g.87224 Transcript_38702/m.87224 type:complete len:264 (-) Transcript_38702:95-886(-)